PRSVHRDDVVAKSDREDVLPVVRLSVDADGRHHHARLPSLERLDHVDATELLENAVILLVPQAMEERAELRPPWHLSGCDLGGADGAEHLADRGAHELLAAGGDEVR